MLPERDYDRGSLLERGWFLGLIVAVAVVVGVALWYVISNPERIASWVSPEDAKPRAEKPVVKPTVRAGN